MSELRTVTVAFTDLVSSTALLGALETSEAERQRAEHVDLVSRAIEAHRGTVVKTLGDGVMAIFASADAALAAAAGAQRAVSVHRIHDAGAFSMRVGISSGDVAARGDDWHGRPVVEASRLCGAADPGQVLLSRVVAQLVGARPFALAEAGRRTLKGLSGEIDLLELRWQETGGAPLRIALADDSALVREGIARLLQSAGFDIVSRAPDGEVLLEDVRRLRPDVVVSDVRMPPGGMFGGLATAEAIRRDDASAAVLLLSTDIDSYVAGRLLATGERGVGYLSKDRVTDLETFVAAIHEVAAGGCVLDSQISAGRSGRRPPSSLHKLNGSLEGGTEPSSPSASA